MPDNSFLIAVPVFYSIAGNQQIYKPGFMLCLVSFISLVL
jgi:hypothetical protein